MLSCLDLRCERGSGVVFSGVGFTLLPGCLLAVRGPNGSGKSSLLKVIAGIIKQSHGTVWYEREEGALYLGHRNALKPELTVKENVRFWCRLHGTEALEEAALRYFGLETFADLSCGELSAGWQRRVALTRLVTVPAMLWLLDEPMTHLDEEGAARVAALIESKCASGGVVLMATHDEIFRGKLSISISEYNEYSYKVD